VEAESEEQLYFNELNADVQDGVYDFLHSANIDDRTAALVHNYNELYSTERILRNFKRFTDFLKL